MNELQRRTAAHGNAGIADPSRINKTVHVAKPSDGLTVGPARVRHIPQSDGSTITEVSLDPRNLATPERSYVADIVGTDISGPFVRLFFAQQKLNSNELRSLIIVSVSPESVRRLIHSSVDFVRKMDSYLATVDIPPSGRLRSDMSEPQHVVVLQSNFVVAGQSGREAEIQFFNMGPFSLHKAQLNRTEVTIEPLVRVSLSVRALRELLQELMESQGKLQMEEQL